MLAEAESGVGSAPKFLALTTVGLTAESDLAALSAGMNKIPGVSLLANATWRSRVETLLRHDGDHEALGRGLAAMHRVTATEYSYNFV